MARLATIPRAQITVTNLKTGQTETREPGSHFGLGGVNAIELDGNTVVIDIGSYRWRFACQDRAEAETRARQIAIRARH